MDSEFAISINQSWIPMRDNVQLLADIYFIYPRIKSPILLCRTPYPREQAASEFNVVALARQGWIVVIQNVRGRLGSEGAYSPFIQEIDDGYDTVLWCKNHPWCDGRVIVFGASYSGWTALACASQHPDGLVAIASIISASDVKSYWFYEGNAFRQAFAQSWGLSFAFTDAAQPSKAIWNAANDLMSMYENVETENMLRAVFPPYANWRNINDDSFWKAIKLNYNLEVPTYILTGWYDIFCEGAISDFKALRRLSVQEYHRLVIGPWTHSTFLSQQAGDLDYTLAANGFVSGTYEEMFLWLKAITDGNNYKSGVSIFVMGANKWVEFDSWPPKAQSLRLYLRENVSNQRALSTEAAPQGICDHYYFSHCERIYNLGGRQLDPTVQGRAGAFDQRRLIEYNKIITYTFYPLNNDVSIIGLLKLRLNLKCSVSSIDLVIKLVDLYPTGEAFNVINTNYRLDIIADQPEILELAVGNIAQMFKQGHAFQLMILSSNFPHVDWNQKFDTDAVCTIYLNDSYLELPFIDI